MKEYKATKRNSCFLKYPFFTTAKTEIDEFGDPYLTLSINKSMVDNDIDVFMELTEWLHDILGFSAHFNKIEQFEKIMLEHYKSLGMPDDLANKITKNIIKNW